jgi:hypothetical protein
MRIFSVCALIGVIFSQTSNADTVYIDTLPSAPQNLGIYVYNDQWIALPIIASSSGLINTITVDAHQSDPAATQPLLVNVCTDNAGIPSSACQSFSTVSPPTTTPAFVKYTGNFTVTNDGQKIWVVFSSFEPTYPYVVGDSDYPLLDDFISSNQGTFWEEVGTGLDLMVSGPDPRPPSPIPTLSKPAIAILSLMLVATFLLIFGRRISRKQ